MTVVLLLHTLCAFVWFGCMMAEAAFSEAIYGSLFWRRFTVLAHGRLDLFVELPAILGVALTGASLANLLPLTPLLTAKIAGGTVAVGLNIFGVLLAGTPFEAGESVHSTALVSWGWTSASVLPLAALAIAAHLLARG